MCTVSHPGHCGHWTLGPENKSNTRAPVVPVCKLIVSSAQNTTSSNVVCVCAPDLELLQHLEMLTTNQEGNYVLIQPENNHRVDIEYCLSLPLYYRHQISRFRIFACVLIVGFLILFSGEAPTSCDH